MTLTCWGLLYSYCWTVPENTIQAATHIKPMRDLFKHFWRTWVLLWAYWYPCFGLLVMSPLGFKARVGSALLALGRGVCVTCSLRFTSGATPADLLAASMAAKRVSSTYLWTGIGRTWTWDLSLHEGTLNRLSYAGSAMTMRIWLLINPVSYIKLCTVQYMS